MNKMLDLVKLKIGKEYTYKEPQLTIDLGDTEEIRPIKVACKNVIDNLFVNASAVSNIYTITFNHTEIADQNEADEFFMTVVNIFSAVFFEHFCLKEGRQREHRLDVPAHLKDIFANMSLIKRAINQKTKCDKFNLIIKWKNGNETYYYELVPQGDE